MRRKKVVVAMSGGVDSSVAAALLKEEGYEVIGVTMSLYSLPEEFSRSKNLRSCSGRTALRDARRVALFLGIPHYVADFRKQFEKRVIEHFCEEYAHGRTPNPCLLCNRYIKFEALVKKAGALEADYIATGHHARIVYDSRSERYLLLKGRDREKDQSYFLYTMTQGQLSRTLMPVGRITKKEVRARAQKLGLPVAHRAESQEICFIPDNDYAGFLRKRAPEIFQPGPIVDLENRVLGQHKGIAHYTIGQRRRMDIAAPHPLYVLSIRCEDNTIVVGRKDGLYKRSILADRVNLISIPRLRDVLKIKAKIRYKHREARGNLIPLPGDQVRLEFARPQRAVTPGQSVVFYDGDIVMGGGVIHQGVN